MYFITINQYIQSYGQFRTYGHPSVPHRPDKQGFTVYILALGGNFGRHQNATYGYQKVATRSRSVSVHLDLSYDASRAHRRGRGDKTKN